MRRTTITTITVNDQRIDYEILGDGEPIVIVSSVAQPLEMVRSLPPVPALTSAGHQVIIFQDLGTAASAGELAENLAGLLERLNLGPVRAWGYSQGAPVTQELALAHPELLRAAAMVATWGRSGAIGRLYLDTLLEITQQEQSGVPRPLEALLLLLGQYPPSMLTNEQLMQPTIESMLNGPPMFDGDLVRRSTLVSVGYDERLEALSGIREIPCLVVGFEFDVLVPASLGREVAEAIPGCHYAEIPGAGHSGAFTHAEQVMDTVWKFFAAT